MSELDFYEPCFGQELEWIMLAAMEQIRQRSRSTYLRLTSKRVDQGLLKVPEDPEARRRLRQQVLNGAYRLIDRSDSPGYDPDENVVHIMASGAMIPEAVAASNALRDEGIFANVVNVTGPGPAVQIVPALGLRLDGRSRQPGHVHGRLDLARLPKRGRS